MNIFLFDFDLDKNARYFKDKDPKRFNKQLVESVQLMAASLSVWNNTSVEKADGSSYVVNRILYHPACKFLTKCIVNHLWHIEYLRALTKLSPKHACSKSFEALNLPVRDVSIAEYLNITNSDMSGIPVNAPVTEFYKRHIENKHLNDKIRRENVTSKR